MTDEVEDQGTGRGRIGLEIYEEVERMTAEGGISRTEAFQRISDSTGRRPGTVAANYYRIARQRGGEGLQPRNRRGPARGRRRRAGSGGDADAVIQRAMGALEELAEVVRRQDAELTRLREQGEQLEKFRKWMLKNP
jgi:hypothetical protein